MVIYMGHRRRRLQLAGQLHNGPYTILLQQLHNVPHHLQLHVVMLMLPLVQYQIYQRLRLVTQEEI
jgi:hypothetical protein